jgi:hypothetical protein
MQIRTESKNPPQNEQLRWGTKNEVEAAIAAEEKTV